MSIVDIRRGHLQSNYNALWGPSYQDIEDSPDKSRADMAVKIIRVLENSGPGWVLDLGSGPHSVEREIHIRSNCRRDRTRKNLIRDSNFVSVDFAKVARRKLLSRGHVNPRHLQSDAANLPFANGAFDIVFANLSIDMLGVESDAFLSSLKESARVLGKRGIFYANFHPAELYDEREGEQFDERIFGVKLNDQPGYYAASVGQPFFETHEQVAEVLFKAGLHTQYIEQRTDDVDGWWAVEAGI